MHLCLAYELRCILLPLHVGYLYLAYELRCILLPLHVSVSCLRTTYDVSCFLYMYLGICILPTNYDVSCSLVSSTRIYILPTNNDGTRKMPQTKLLPAFLALVDNLIPFICQTVGDFSKFWLSAVSY